MRVIAGDVGGTKTLLQCIDGDAVSVEHRYESGSFPTFGAMLRDFVLRCHEPVHTACFAVAGPVLGRTAGVTNLGWSIDADVLERELDIPHIALINDFEAVAFGVPMLAEEDVLTLQQGTSIKTAPIAILGAGTGLGEAVVTFGGGRWSVIASEGGHADFAPQDEEQAKLFLALLKKYGHVSWERLLSGMGIVNIHNFIAGLDEPYREELPAEIVAAYDRGDDDARRTVEMFVDIYGAEAGNAALRVLARGGVFLAGGIAARNPTWFTDGRFVASFLRKGRFHELLREMPIKVITNARVGLMGAAEMARRISA
jgi:glucokinase